MKILHYFLGFPPYRTGGLTRYSFDLMQEQVRDGNAVYALWPGKIRIFNHNVAIRERKKIKGIRNFELINPLPVPLDEGISEINIYTKKCNLAVYDVFLKEIQPDVIHIHTLMGMHKEFIDVAIKLEIRTVYTTHDYFGICPKVNLYHDGRVCDDDHNCEDCVQCNQSALSLKKIILIQSPVYRVLKNSWIIKKIRKWHRDAFFLKGQPSSTVIMPESVVKTKAESYQKLRLFYVDMLERISCIHFNSTVTEHVYKKYITPKNSVILNISHKNIVDNRQNLHWKSSDKLRITMLAPARPFKGFDILQKALDELWCAGKINFILNVFGPVRILKPYMVINPRGFKQDELSKIFSETDILVAPSVWYETFGFTVLEALSYGVPVLVSSNVGAKDIIGDGGIIVEAGNVSALKDALVSLNKEKLLRLHDAVANSVYPLVWRTFVDQNYKLYGD